MSTKGKVSVKSQRAGNTTRTLDIDNIYKWVELLKKQEREPIFIRKVRNAKS